MTILTIAATTRETAVRSRGRIVIADANLAGFTFSLSGNELIFTGGSLTLSNLNYATVAASAAPEGGVQITFSSPAIVLSAGASVSLAVSANNSAQSAQAADLMAATKDVLVLPVLRDDLASWHMSHQTGHLEALHLPQSDLFVFA